MVSSDYITILHQNIAGLCNKLDDIEIALVELKDGGREIDILCFTETFVKRCTETNIKLNNYKLASTFCRERSRGGSCIMIKRVLDFRPIAIVTELATEFCFECCGLEIIGLDLIVINIYRIPEQTVSHIGIFIHKLNKLLQHVTCKFRRKKIVLCGDWNINILNLNWATREIFDTLHNYNFNIHIQQPTRGKSCIDLIASNIKNVESQIHVLGLSDHETAQTISFKAKKYLAYSTWFEYKRDFGEENARKFYECLSALSYSDIMTSYDTETAFEYFYELLRLFFDLCFPLVKVKMSNRSNNVKWLTRGLKRACKVKRTLYLKYKNCKNNKKENRSRFYKYGNILKKCIQSAQKIYNNKHIKNNTNKCKATWTAISSTISNNVYDKDIINIQYDNIIYSQPNDICNVFNDYFINLTNRDPLTLNNKAHNYNNCIAFNSTTIFLTPVSDHETYNIIMSLKNSKSGGIDGLVTKILKLCALYVAPPLAHIINLSFSQGIFPKQLKLSVVKPIFKKGDKLDVNNYRPITLVPILSKVFEKAFHKRITNFLDKFGILHSDQFGFRKGSSTTLAGFEFLRNVAESLNDGIPIASVFLDMSKAFDFVSHDILLNKLNRYGIRGKAHHWVESYLKDRLQCTEVTSFTETRYTLMRKTYSSTFRINKKGVPQGSILGPLLFLLYINDLPNSVPHKTILYADDTTLLIKCHKKDSFEFDVNKALTDVTQWMNENELILNTTKTRLMQYVSYNSDPMKIVVKCDNNRIEEVSDFKSLGIVIDKNLNWKKHIDEICNKLNRFVFALKKVRQTVSFEAALTSYHGYVSSVLSYGLILWGNSVDIDRAFKVQKKCMRAVCNAKFDDSCRPLFKLLNVLPLPSMYIRDVGLFVHTNPQYFKTRGEVSHRYTRARFASQLYKPLCRKYLYERNVFNMCIVIYNSLPADIKLLRGNVFKSKLTKWLLEKCFYSVNDYLNH